MVSRQPTFFFRLIAWLAVMSLMAVAPRTEAQADAAWGHQVEHTLSRAACNQDTLLGTHTFEANPSPLACPLRSLDTPLFSTSPDARVAVPSRTPLRQFAVCAMACPPRATLVGIVELRI